MNLKDIKELVYITPKERRSIYTLLVVTGIFLIVSVLTSIYYRGNPAISDEALYSLIQRWENELEVEKGITKNFKMENFDPNEITIDQLLAYGWREYPAKSLINYREKGGVFRVKSDLQKIYGIDEPFYQEIYNFIELPENLYIEPEIMEDKPENVPSASKVDLQVFDPNTVELADLLAMGWPKYVAQNLIKYRESGGFYKEISDLRKIYGMTDSIYQNLKNYVKIDSTRFSRDINNVRIEPYELNENIVPVNLNACTEAELMELKGIGPSYARRIIRFRERLGGFHNVNQLYDVPYIDSAAVTNNLKYFTTDNRYKRLHINELDFKEILAHPYISYEATKSMSSYFRLRDQKIYLDSFLRKGWIDKDTLLKLEPYLRLE